MTKFRLLPPMGPLWAFPLAAANPRRGAFGGQGCARAPIGKDLHGGAAINYFDIHARKDMEPEREADRQGFALGFAELVYRGEPSRVAGWL